MNDELWLAEFRGFFYGEGSVEINRFHRGSWTGYRPRLRITLRADEVAILEDIHRRFGGNIITYKDSDAVIHHASGKSYKSNPHCAWDLVGIERCRPIVDILLDGRLPARKREQLLILREYLSLNLNRGVKHTPEIKAKIIDIVERLKESRQYRC